MVDGICCGGFDEAGENYRIVVFFSACFRAILLNEMGVPKPMRFAKRRINK